MDEDRPDQERGPGRGAPGTQAGSVPPNLPGALPENAGKGPADVEREKSDSA